MSINRLKEFHVVFLLCSVTHIHTHTHTIDCWQVTSDQIDEPFLTQPYGKKLKSCMLHKDNTIINKSTRTRDEKKRNGRKTESEEDGKNAKLPTIGQDDSFTYLYMGMSTADTPIYLYIYLVICWRPLSKQNLRLVWQLRPTKKESLYFLRPTNFLNASTQENRIFFSFLSPLCLARFGEIFIINDKWTSRF